MHDTQPFRYFVTEVLDTIAPPYSGEFVQLFLPLVENDEILGKDESIRIRIIRNYQLIRFNLYDHYDPN